MRHGTERLRAFSVSCGAWNHSGFDRREKFGERAGVASRPASNAGAEFHGSPRRAGAVVNSDMLLQAFAHNLRTGCRCIHRENGELLSPEARDHVAAPTTAFQDLSNVANSAVRSCWPKLVTERAQVCHLHAN